MGGFARVIAGAKADWGDRSNDGDVRINFPGGAIGLLGSLRFRMGGMALVSQHGESRMIVMQGLWAKLSQTNIGRLYGIIDEGLPLLWESGGEGSHKLPNEESWDSQDSVLSKV